LLGVALAGGLALGAAGAAAATTDAAAAGVPPPPYRGAAGSIVVRVGLETDLQRVVVPCCEAVWIEHGGARRAVAGGLEARPGGKARMPVYKLQAAALKDEDQARALASVLERSSGAESSVSFDVASSLYRVRLGRFPSRDAADRFRQRVADQGLAEGWVVAEGGGLEHAAMVVTSGGETHEAAGRWLVVEPQAQPGVRLDRGRFRGRLLVYLNDRGLLNLIDELPLEDYVRGVVPVEMGPDLYDSLESLKAQAVAARTFTVRGLGGFAAEGFDLCASPRCQAYGGMASEHPLSDRAVAETAGEVVLYDGEVAEALYSASCGGSTEDVEVVFPRKTGAHLRAVACPERGVVRLDAGTPAAAGVSYTHRLLERLLTARAGGAAPAAGASRTGSPAPLQATVEALLGLAGLPLPDDALASLERGEVRRFLASALDLVLDARVLHDPAEEASTDWSADERRLHARFLGAGAGGSILGAAEAEDLAFDVARLLGLAVEERAYFLGYGSAGVEVRTGAERRTLALAPGVATFARRNGQLQGSALELAAGDRLRLAWSGDRLLAVVSDHDGPADPPRPAAPWTVFRREDELRRSIATLYPGFALRDLEVVSRGASGRIGKLRLLGQGDDTVVLEGLAVRWTLGTPETWFDARREVRDGQRGWVLQGRGRGHGVGLCQLGAVAMSRRGHSYREILAHYYSGAKLGRLQS
jgi:stage II sporulation protein D